MSGKVTPGYKQTEVGLIPVEWEVKPLADVVDFLDGRRRPVKDTDRAKMRGNIPYYGASGIVDYVNDFLFDEDLILLGEDGENILSRNCRLAFKISGKAWVNNHAHVLRPKRGMSLDYLAEFLESQDFAQYNTGTAQPKINKFVCSGIPVVCPSWPEQCSIAAALSDVDALIGALDQLIYKKRDIKQAAMQQLLTGKKRLPGFGKKASSNKQTEIGVIPDDWRAVKVKEFASIKTGKRNTQDRVDDGAYPFFVRSQVIEHINSYSFDGEAVLTAGDGVGTGKVFHYINGKFDIHQRVYKISDFSPDLDGYFFFLVFSSRFYDRIMSMTAKSSVDSVRMEMIADMLIALPPDAEEQRAIANVLSDMDSELSTLEQRRDKAFALKQGMMQELLTGRIRLV